MVRTMSNHPYAIIKNAIFPLGEVVATMAIGELMEEGKEQTEWVLACLNRHAGGDWGDLVDEDKKANDEALSESYPDRIFSAYVHEEYGKIWIITEWDRTITTILRPEEY